MTDEGGQLDDPAVTSSELLAAAAARGLVDRRTIFAGHGLPTLAVALAQHSVSPRAEVIYESGVTGAHPTRLPQSISDSMLVTGAEGVLTMSQLFNYVLQGQRIDVAFLGAAQIDKYGSLNSTLIGDDWARPQSRLPGSGGAIEVMANAGEVFVVMRRHTNRTFVESVDFCTSPSPKRARDTGGGPQPTGLGVTRVITDLGIMARTEIEEELTLVALHPGVTVDNVQAATGWDLKVSASIDECPPPSPRELALLRETLDPKRIYLR